MNVTLGVPRIREIHAARAISTPIIEAPLEQVRCARVGCGPALPIEAAWSSPLAFNPSSQSVLHISRRCTCFTPPCPLLVVARAYAQGESLLLRAPSRRAWRRRRCSGDVSALIEEGVRA